MIAFPSWLPVRVAKGTSLVILSEEEFEGWKETVQLLSNPANAQRLLDSVREAEAGLTVEHELVEVQVPLRS